VKLYQDCHPNCLETAPLQKGLVLVLRSRELIEEGMGFGVPVVKYKDKTYFSSSANSWLRKEGDSCILGKMFVLDTISRKRIGQGSYVNDKLYHFLHRAFEIGYLNFQSLTHISNKIIELQEPLNVQTIFKRVEPRGTVLFEYSCKPKEVQITVRLSLSKLDKCKEILILNEQGSSFFRRYADSSGLVLFDRNIGPWAKVNAYEASFSDVKQTSKFTLESKVSTTLVRGWEKTKGHLAWAGLEYSLPSRNSSFSYSIRLS